MRPGATTPGLISDVLRRSDRRSDPATSRYFRSVIFVNASRPAALSFAK